MNDDTAFFDRFLTDLLPSACVGATMDSPSYPPTDIIKIGDDAYAIVMAVAGFSRDELKVSVENNVLTVDGQHKVAEADSEDPVRVYLHKGIAKRKFRKQFTLQKNVQVRYADLNDGLLTIDIDIIVPMSHEAVEIPIF